MRLIPTAVFALCFLPLLTSCADDAVEWTVTIISDRSTLPGTGGSPVTLQMSVLDQDRNPAEQGEAIVVVCTTATADVAVLVNGAETGTASLLLDEFGSASAQVTCTNASSTVADVVCVARFTAGDARANALLRCTGTAPAP